MYTRAQEPIDWHVACTMRHFHASSLVDNCADSTDNTLFSENPAVEMAKCLIQFLRFVL